jgi:hypothetical protein
MKAVPIVGVLLVMATQTIAFVVLWNWMVTIARSHDRFPREIAFGIGIHYGAMMMIALFIGCGIVAAFSSRPRLRWGAILGGLLAWVVLLSPALESRPFALPAFIVLGATILIVGTGFGVPYFRRLAIQVTARESIGEQAGADQPAAAVK